MTAKLHPISKAKTTIRAKCHPRFVLDSHAILTLFILFLQVRRPDQDVRPEHEPAAQVPARPRLHGRHGPRRHHRHHLDVSVSSFSGAAAIMFGWTGSVGFLQIIMRKLFGLGLDSD